jgi:hypothetical protein
MKGRRLLVLFLNAVLLAFALTIPARAQDNYEIQVYSYDTGCSRSHDGGTSFHLHRGRQQAGHRRRTRMRLKQNYVFLSKCDSRNSYQPFRIAYTTNSAL